MHLAEQGLIPVPGLRHIHLRDLFTQRPDAAKMAMRSLRAAGGPFHIAFWRAVREHEPAGGIRAIS